MKLINNLWAIGAVVSLSLALCTPAITQTVTFYANITDPSTSQIPGHVWVGIREKSGYETFWGFYGDGLRGEDRAADISFSFKVASLDPVYRVIQEYRSKGYRPLVRDCRGFVSDLARALNLRTPSIGIQSPAEWLGELAELNPK